MSILRRHLSTGFTVLPTATLEDSRLSFRARGILAYLIAKPDSWKVRTESITQAGKEGRDAVRDAVKELKALGYYRVATERNDNGHLFSITEVYDTAQEWVAKEYLDKEARRIARKVARKLEQESSAATEDGFPGVGSPVAGSPVTGEPGGIGSNQSKYPEKDTPLPPQLPPQGSPMPDQVQAKRRRRGRVPRTRIARGAPAVVAVRVRGSSGRRSNGHRRNSSRGPSGRRMSGCWSRCAAILAGRGCLR